MPRLTLAIAVAATLLAIALVAWVDPAGAPPAIDDAQTSAGGRTAAGATAPGDRVAAASARVPSCRGRCVDWDDGRPLAGCAIVVGEGVTALSDGDGRFAFSRPLAAGAVRVQGDCHLAVVRSLPSTDGDVDLGEVRLRRGVRVTGELLDERQQPQPDIALAFLTAGRMRRADGWRETWSTRATTEGDGTFALATVMPRGTVDVVADGAPPLVGPTSFALGNGEHRHLRLRCRAVGPGDSITGRVRDAAGRPVPDAVVEAFAAGGSVGSARCDAAGSFRLYRRDGAPEAVGLRATATDPARRAELPGSVSWGAAAVAITLPAGAGVPVRVTGAADGAPIERYAISWGPTAGLLSAATVGELPIGDRRDGWAWLERVRSGPNALIVWPEDPRWLPSLPVRFDHAAAGSPVRVALRRARQLRLRVLRANAEPAAGVEVALVLPGGALLRDLPDFFAHGGSRMPPSLRLSSGTTDRAGRASLRWHPGDTPLELRLQGAGIVPAIERDVVLSARAFDDELVVRLAAVARLQGRISTPQPARLVLEPVGGGEWWPPAWVAPAAIAADGGIACDVPPGRWRVRLRVEAAAGEWALLPDEFATLDIRAGDVAQLDLDLSDALATGTLSGTAFVDGAPADSLVLFLGETDAGGALRARSSRSGHADARGWYAFDRLPAGHYRLEARIRCSGRTIAVPIGGWRRVMPGENWSFEPAAIVTNRTRIRLVDGEQRPLAARQLEFVASPGIALFGTTDADGVVAFDRMPAGSYRVRLRAGETRRELGTLEVAGGAPVAREFAAR